MPDWLPKNLAEAVVFTPLRIVFLVVVAIIARWVICKVIDRSVRMAIKQPESARLRAATRHIAALTTGPENRRAQRLSALGSLSRSIVTVVIVVVTTLTILAELKFDVTSLVAGTSIVAGAIAFGMQNIIRDFVSGVFILIEDQLGVGDWVMLQGGGEAAGQVVEVGLRITRLRQPDGTICAVRNGELLRVINYSQGGPNRVPDDEPVGAAPQAEVPAQPVQPVRPQASPEEPSGE